MKKDPIQELHDTLVAFGYVLAESIGLIRFMDWLAKILNTKHKGG